MNRPLFFALLVCLAAPLARGADTNDSGWYAPLADAMHAMRVTRAPLVHGQRLSRPGAPPPVLAGPELKYFGGPLLSGVKVQLVYWNDAVAYQDKLPAFYSAVTQSAYFDWLVEYSTGTAALGRGSYLGVYTDHVPPSGGPLKDEDIQAELSRLVDASAVPQPDANTLYMVYFPPGVDIASDGERSCKDFCAYHSAFLRGGKAVIYGVIPDQAACAGGCGHDGDLFNNETSVSSHEMIEAVTDPDIGLVQGKDPVYPAGWYDPGDGEIGDICNNMHAQVAGYTVQRMWSNARRACVATADDLNASAAPSGQSDISRR